MNTPTRSVPYEDIKAKVFISYARSDLAFADRLESALITRGVRPLIDRSEIHAFEDWWKRIETLISQADTIVFVLSPGAVRPDSVCHKEVAFAESLNKRFAPVVCQRVDDKTVPATLARLNFVFLDDPAAFDRGVDRLVEALRVDIDWIRKHTEFGELARRWAAAGRPGPAGLLLRASPLEEAERWIAARPGSAPEPTEATRAFIAESRNAEVAEKAAKEQQILRWRRATGTGFAVPARRGLEAGLYDKAIRYAVAGAILADDPGFQLAPELRGPLLRAGYELRNLALLDAKSAVDAAAFSPDGLHVVTLPRDGVGRLWDAHTGAEIRTFKIPVRYPGAFQFVAFSPDGSCFVTARSDDAIARVWNSDSGAEVALLADVGPVEALAFGKGLLTITSTGASATRWLPTGWMSIGEPLTIERSGSDSNLVVFSINERAVQVGKEFTARLLAAGNGEQLAVLTGHQGRITGAVFGPDDRRLVTTSEDSTARLWDGVTGEAIAVLQGHDSTVWAAAVSPDGTRILTPSDDTTARLWDAKSGALLFVLRGHRGAVTRAMFGPDGSRLLTVSADNTARVWEAETGVELAVLSGHEDRIVDAAFSPDGERVVTASTDGSARVWDANPRRARIVQGGADKLDWSERGDPQRSNPLGVDKPVWLTSAEAAVAVQCAYSRDGARAAVTWDQLEASLWDTAGKVRIAVLQDGAARLSGPRFSPDGSQVAIPNNEGLVHIWDANTGAKIAVLQGHDGRVWRARFSPDSSRIVTTSADGTARIWKASTGDEIRVLDHHRPLIGIQDARFSSDGRRVTTAAGEDAWEWDVADTVAFACLPALAAPLARVRNGLGTVRGPEVEDPLLKEAPRDLYSAALEKWSELAASVDEAASLLSGQSVDSGDKPPAAAKREVPATASAPAAESPSPAASAAPNRSRAQAAAAVQPKAPPPVQSAPAAVADTRKPLVPTRRGHLGEELYQACSRDDVKTAVRLLEDGADVHYVRDGFTPLHMAAGSSSDDPTIPRMLIDRGIDIDGADSKHGMTALHAAADYGNLAIVRLLIECGANINAVTFKFITALDFAYGNKHDRVFHLLLEKGADMEAGRRMVEKRVAEAQARKAARRSRLWKLAGVMFLVVLCATAAWVYLSDPAILKSIRKMISDRFT